MQKTSVISPEEFYINCVTDLHKMANRLGFVQGDHPISVPELLTHGKNIIVSYFTNKDFCLRLQPINEPNPENLFRRMIEISVNSGLLLGLGWISNESKLQDISESIINKEPIIFKTYEDIFDMVPMNVYQLYGDLYCEFTEQLYPIWEKIQNKEPYLLNAFLAVFQTGVTAIMEKNGYR